MCLATYAAMIRLSPSLLRPLSCAAAVLGAALSLGAAGAQPQPTPRAGEPANRDIVEALGPTDGQIAVEVQTRLNEEVPGTTLTARIDDGVATLEGTVETPSDRRRAARIARGVEGVRSVVNEIEVDETAVDDPPLGNSGATLETAVAAELRGDPVLGARDIRVVADRSTNTVTLIGEVESPAERERAMRVATRAFTAGTVRNQLIVRQER